METTGIVNDIVDEIVTCGRVLRRQRSALTAAALVCLEAEIGIVMVT